MTKLATATARTSLVVIIVILHLGGGAFRRLGLRQGADTHDLSAWKGLHHGEHKWVLRNLRPNLTLFALLAFPKALGAASALRRDQPAHARPFFQPPHQALGEVIGRAGRGFIFDGAGTKTDRPYKALDVQFQRNVPLTLDERQHFLEGVEGGDWLGV